MGFRFGMDLKDIEERDILKIGLYDMKGNGEKEDISWIVLKKEEDRLLLISKHALDFMEFNDSFKQVSYEESSLRKWLNNEFYESAFSKEEKEAILTTKVAYDINPLFETETFETEDKVFILSMEEANSYFEYDSDRAYEVTEYAKKKGAIDTESLSFWLRTPGQFYSFASNVRKDGSIFMSGSMVNEKKTVRPVISIRR